MALKGGVAWCTGLITACGSSNPGHCEFFGDNFSSLVASSMDTQVDISNLET